MPNAHLFAINKDGFSYSLQDDSTAWSECAYVGLEFISFSGVPNFLWAIGGDRQVYLYVYDLDIPIKVKEVTFENERWFPLDGFTNSLLPTDRHPFSSEDGLEDREFDQITLPSSAWTWDSSWELELTLDGKTLDHEGWTYAVDFPRKYSPQKQWSSCVRRRKWVRYRRYAPLNTWYGIRPLHKDKTEEAFNNVSIGGHLMPGAVPGTMLVWAVTTTGRALFRSGVTTMRPEGSHWISVAPPDNNDIKQISVGPTGLVWAVLWSGQAVVRKGVTRDCFTGEDWVYVPMPEDDVKIGHVSVGNNAVWAVTTCYEVWFVRGIAGDRSGLDIRYGVGNGWVRMVCQMSCVSVSPNDQVFAVGVEDHVVYFRTGVTSTDLTGKTWRALTSEYVESLPDAAPLQWFRSVSSQSTYRRSSSQSQRSQSQLSTQESHSNHSTPRRIIRPSGSSQASSEGSGRGDNVASTSYTNINSKTKGCRENTRDDLTGKCSSDAGDSDVGSMDINDLHNTLPYVPTTGTDTADKISLSSCGAEPSIVEEVRPVMDEVFLAESMEAASYGVMWNWVDAGAACIDIYNLPKWFLDNQPDLSNTQLLQPWRRKILDELRFRNGKVTIEFESYERAVDMYKSSTKRGNAQSVFRPGNAYVEDSLLELEWTGRHDGDSYKNTLTILSRDGRSIKSSVNLWNIARVSCSSEPGSPRLAIYTKSSHGNEDNPLRLQFASDTEMEDWLGTLSHVCSQINGTQKTPSSRAIWGTTSWGDVFVFDPVPLEERSKAGDRQIAELEVFEKPMPLLEFLHNGFTLGSRLTLIGSAIGDNKRFHLDLLCPDLEKGITKGKNQHDIALHFNPRFEQNVVVINSRRNGVWETELRLPNKVFEIGVFFQLEIFCKPRCFEIFVNGNDFGTFTHRLEPQKITHVQIDAEDGNLKLTKLKYESAFDISPRQMFWRQMGGHLWKVESCTAGVTWGISYDCVPWVYTGGWGGCFLNSFSSSSSNIHPVRDTHLYYVYEHERWTPFFGGYTTHLLPTDRPVWSDATGRHKRTRESVKLLSMHWQWVTDWAIDYNTPGGVDKDGWQYAIDFPSTYKAKKCLTDFVRRRRWYRKCGLKSTGPWQKAGDTKLLDISLVSSDASSDSPITVWAVTNSGDALVRKGVMKSNPAGVAWGHITSDEPLVSISCGEKNKIWAVGRNGSAYWRFGVNLTNPTGQSWQSVDTPNDTPVRQISVGYSGVWVLDNRGRLSVRCEVTPVFPEGTHWKTVTSPKADASANKEESQTTVLTPATPSACAEGWRHVSVGPSENGGVWAVTTQGVLYRRLGISPEIPEGTSWSEGAKGSWQQVSSRGWTSQPVQNDFKLRESQ